MLRLEVDGLPPEMFARMMRAADAGWRTQWAKYGERIESLPLMATPGAALIALEETLRSRGYNGAILPSRNDRFGPKVCES